MIDQMDDPITQDWTGNFFSNSGDVVAQQVYTRLNLWYGEWFLDTSDGTPYLEDILGFGTNYDLEIKSRILGTQGVTEIISYSSSRTNRVLSVNALIQTIYGPVPITIILGK